jgi:dihydrofolate synthase/folylpolyglutamate synthase
LHLVFGTLADKDSEGIAAALYPLADHLIATRPPSERAAPIEELMALGATPTLRHAIADPREALAKARQAAAPEDLICVCGSTYLVGALRPLLIES